MHQHTLPACPLSVINTDGELTLWSSEAYSAPSDSRVVFKGKATSNTEWEGKAEVNGKGG